MCYSKYSSPNHTLKITVQVPGHEITLVLQKQSAGNVGQLDKTDNLLRQREVRINEWLEKSFEHLAKNRECTDESFVQMG